MVCEVAQTMAVWKTVLPNSHGLSTHSGKTAALPEGTKPAKPGYNEERNGSTYISYNYFIFDLSTLLLKHVIFSESL